MEFNFQGITYEAHLSAHLKTCHDFFCRWKNRFRFKPSTLAMTDQLSWKFRSEEREHLIRYNSARVASGVVHKWHHSHRWLGSSVLWWRYKSLSNKTRDDGGTGCQNCVTPLMDDLFFRNRTFEIHWGLGIRINIGTCPPPPSCMIYRPHWKVRTWWSTLV